MEMITTFEVGERLDKTLAKLYPEYSRSAIEKLIQQDQILVNSKSKKSKYILKGGDRISVNFSELDKAPDQIDLPILYEDENVVVIGKPVGVLAHSKGNFNKEGTVASFISGRLTGSPEWLDSNRAGIVHRLDRATSGVMIAAKNEETQKFLQKQFAKRNVKKRYVAVTANNLPEVSGTIDVPIERNPKKPATFRAGINGKAAQTDFRVLKSNNTYALVELQPLTGRTHQLRVHLSYLKCPIVGDEYYGGEVADRLMLHAHRLEITVPGSQRKSFTAPLPSQFKKYVS